MRHGPLILIAPALIGFAAVQAHALNIIPTFSSSITGDSNAMEIEDSINSALNVYDTTFTNPITVSIYFNEVSTGLGGSGFGSDLDPQIDYSTYRSDLLGESSIASTLSQDLPVNNPVPSNGDDMVQASTAQLRAIGDSGAAPADVIGGNTYDDDISLNTSIMNLSRTGLQDASKYDIIGVTEHEIGEVLGLSSGLDGQLNAPVLNPVPPGSLSSGPYVDSMDFYRYSSLGTLSFTNDPNAVAYFSIDGGQTKLDYFNQQTGGDFHDWASSGEPYALPPEVQDAYDTPGIDVNLGPNEITALKAIGYNTPNAAAVPGPSSLCLTVIGFLGLMLALIGRLRKQPTLDSGA